MTDDMLGLRSLIAHVDDLAAAKAWYTDVLGVSPYFDEPYYVGFNVGGFEFGLNPDTSKVAAGRGGNVAYWGVKNAEAAFARIVALGAQEVEGVADVGGDIKVGILQDPFGNLFGIIENPHFKAMG